MNPSQSSSRCQIFDKFVRSINLVDSDKRPGIPRFFNDRTRVILSLYFVVSNFRKLYLSEDGLVNFYLKVMSESSTQPDAFFSKYLYLLTSFLDRKGLVRKDILCANPSIIKIFFDFDQDSEILRLFINLFESSKDSAFGSAPSSTECVSINHGFLKKFVSMLLTVKSPSQSGLHYLAKLVKFHFLSIEPVFEKEESSIHDTNLRDSVSGEPVDWAKVKASQDKYFICTLTSTLLRDFMHLLESSEKYIFGPENSKPLQTVLSKDNKDRGLSLIHDHISSFFNPIVSQIIQKKQRKPKKRVHKGKQKSNYLLKSFCKLQPLSKRKSFQRRQETPRKFKSLHGNILDTQAQAKDSLSKLPRLNGTLFNAKENRQAQHQHQHSGVKQPSKRHFYKSLHRPAPYKSK